MKRQHLAAVLTALLLAFGATTALAAVRGDDEDTDTHLVNAEVVEISDARISVIARTGVEHVIAIDRANTNVTVDGQKVSLKDVRVGDVITVDLDEKNPMKFAKVITLNTAGQTQVARARR